MRRCQSSHLLHQRIWVSRGALGPPSESFVEKALRRLSALKHRHLYWDTYLGQRGCTEERFEHCNFHAFKRLTLDSIRQPYGENGRIPGKQYFVKGTGCGYPQAKFVQREGLGCFAPKPKSKTMYDSMKLKAFPRCTMQQPKTKGPTSHTFFTQTEQAYRDYVFS